MHRRHSEIEGRRVDATETRRTQSCADHGTSSARRESVPAILGCAASDPRALAARPEQRLRADRQPNPDALARMRALLTRGLGLRRGAVPVGRRDPRLPSSSPNRARLTNCPKPGSTFSSPSWTTTVPRISVDVDVARHLGALVEVVVRLRMLASRGDRLLAVRVEDHDVRVGAGGDRALAGIEAEELRRVRREQLDHPVERDPALSGRRTRGSSTRRSSRPGPPFGIFEKSSLPIVFWPSQRNAQWSVEIAERTSVRTASQRTSWLAFSRAGGE